VGHEARPIGLSCAIRKALYFKANSPHLPSALRHFLNMQIPPPLKHRFDQTSRRAIFGNKGVNILPSRAEF